jgi:hypothetical protein
VRIHVQKPLIFGRDSPTERDSNGNLRNASFDGSVIATASLTVPEGIHDLDDLPSWVTGCSTYLAAVSGGGIVVIEE